MKIKKLKITDQVFRQLQEDIITGKYKPGTWLPSQNKLAEDMGVSRPSVREAINKLTSLGMVDPRQGAGTLVLPYDGEKDIFKTGTKLNLSPQDILDMTVVRFALERIAIRLTAINADEEGLKAIQDQLDTQKAIIDSGNFENFPQADVNFHLLLANLSKNQYYISFMESNKSLLYKIISSILNPPFTFPRSYETHCKIAEAVFSKDPDFAETAISEAYYLTLNRLPKSEEGRLAHVIEALF